MAVEVTYHKGFTLSEKLKDGWLCFIAAAWKLELLRLCLAHQVNLNMFHVILCSVRGPL